MSPKSRFFPENGVRIWSSSSCARRELPSTRKHWIANRGGVGGLKGASIGGRACGLGGSGFVGACAIVWVAHRGSINPVEIGRASGRGRGEIFVVGGSFK